MQERRLQVKFDFFTCVVCGYKTWQTDGYKLSCRHCGTRHHTAFVARLYSIVPIYGTCGGLVHSYEAVFDTDAKQILLQEVKEIGVMTGI